MDGREIQRTDIDVFYAPSHTALGRISVRHRGDPAGGFMGSERDILALVAFANHALPDASPNRITRADVKLIRAACDRIRRTLGNTSDDKLARAGLFQLYRTADKLAALLPPDLYAPGSKCPDCGGDGVYLYENAPPGECPTCNGTGTIPPADSDD